MNLNWGFTMRSFWSWFRLHGRRFLSIILGIILLVAAIGWMSGVFRSKIQPGVVEMQQEKEKPRTLATVEQLPLLQTINVVGTVEARRKTEVAGQILATIREVKVNAGDAVHIGQTLAILDDREIQAQLRESEAAASGAQADLEVRKRDLARYQEMLDGKAVTKEEFDRVQGAYKAAEAQMKRIEQQIARIKVMLTHTEIEAHAAGIVANRYVDPGDLAAPGKTLFTLYDPRERELHASIPESLMSDIKLDASLLVRIDAVGREWQGIVREIVPQAQEASRSILIKITLPAEAADVVLVGMFGRLSIPTGEAKLIVVPTQAVRHVGQEDIVEVIGKNEKVERRFVRTGQVYGGKTEILSGLNVGEKVVLPRE